MGEPHEHLGSRERRNSGDVAACVVSDPDVRAIKRRCLRTDAHGKSALDRAVTGAKPGYIVAAGVCNPDVGAIKHDSGWTITHSEGALNCAVAGPQLGHVAAAE